MISFFKCFNTKTCQFIQHICILIFKFLINSTFSIHGRTWQYLGIYCCLCKLQEGQTKIKWYSSSISDMSHSIHFLTFLWIFLCLPTSIFNLCDDNRILAKLFVNANPGFWSNIHYQTLFSLLHVTNTKRHNVM